MVVYRTDARSGSGMCTEHNSDIIPEEIHKKRKGGTRKEKEKGVKGEKRTRRGERGEKGSAKGRRDRRGQD